MAVETAIKSNDADNQWGTDAEELLCNWEQRVEELVALEAIYGEDFRITGLTCADGEEMLAVALTTMAAPQQPHHIYCSVSIHVGVPAEGLQVCMALPSPNSKFKQLRDSSKYPSIDAPKHPSKDPCKFPSKGTQAASPPLFPIGTPVHYLTPLQLKLNLPPRYPSRCMPCYKILCRWMDKEQIQSASAQLEELWEQEGRGQPFCYAWIEWLQNQLLSHLGINGQLVLSSTLLAGTPAALEGSQGSSSSKSSGGSNSDWMARCVQHMEDVAISIVRYAGMREQANFEQGTWRCCICFEDTPGKRCLRLPDCAHFFCTECITQHCKTKVKDGSVDSIHCPIPDCRLAISPCVLRQLLTKDEFERWDELLLSRTLDRMEDVVYCPRCKTSTVEDKDHCAQCPGCFYTFCSLCHDAWHTGERCVDPVTRIRILEERSKGNRTVADKMAAQNQDLINQVKSLKLVNDTTRACPSCQMAIQRSEGCNKMVCSYCSTIFCYKCGNKITGYDHFGSKSCELIDADTITRWNAMVNGWQPDEDRREQMEHGQVAAQAAQMFGNQLGHPFLNHLRNCPVCGQANLKTNNNNAMRCWACGCAFCYRCHTYIRGKVSMHFKPKGMCMQHSDD